MGLLRLFRQKMMISPISKTQKGTYAMFFSKKNLMCLFSLVKQTFLFLVTPRIFHSPSDFYGIKVGKWAEKMDFPTFEAKKIAFGMNFARIFVCSIICKVKNNFLEKKNSTKHPRYGCRYVGNTFSMVKKGFETPPENFFSIFSKFIFG